MEHKDMSLQVSSLFFLTL